MKIRHSHGSDNVFADLGVANADEYLAKADLAREIINVIREQKLTQEQAAKVLHVDQPKICALNRGRLDGFSMERLFRFLTLLGRRIEINVAAEGQVAPLVVRRPTQLAPASHTSFRIQYRAYTQSRFAAAGSTACSIVTEDDEWKMAEPLVVAQNQYLQLSQGGSDPW